MWIPDVRTPHGQDTALLDEVLGSVQEASARVLVREVVCSSAQ
jgi:hypothetical protein